MDTFFRVNRVDIGESSCMRFNSQLRSIGHESIIGCNFGLRLHLASLDADLDDGSRLELVHKMDLCMRVLKTSTYFWITTEVLIRMNLCEFCAFSLFAKLQIAFRSQ